VCETEGIPTVVVVTEVFENLAGLAARARGYESLRTLVLPHPMETRSEDEIRRMVRARLRDIAGLLVSPSAD
jgi:hypothetical protein